MQTRCVPSAGYVLPCIRGLNHHMQAISSKYHSTFVLALKESLRKRLSYFEENEIHITATILDPRFKLRWCLEETEKKECTEIILTALEKSVQSPSPDTSVEEMPIELPKSKRAKSLFSFMPVPVQSKEPSIESICAMELDVYLLSPCVSMDTNSADFWKRENKYTKLAKEVLGVPSSSAPVKRLFSIAGKIFRPERCNLTDSRFEQLMFIRCNNN